MRLFIDGQETDIDSSADISVSLSISSLTSIEYGRTGYSKSITIPMTARNREIMGDCEQLNARDRFNDAMHSARIEDNGFTVLEGAVFLAECSNTLAGGYYKFNIIGAGKQWAQYASSQKFSALFPEYAATITGSKIRQSWTDASYVRYLPVQRGIYELENSSVSLMPAVRVLSTSDYHPFINIWSVVERVFGDAGYSVSSRFMDSPWFRSLYMSGNYPTREAELLKEKMDFYAERFEPVSATADESGLVYANPYVSYNTIGNIVDTANPGEICNGKTLDNVFSNGGCFRKEGREIVFVPTETVSMSFEYKIRYVTDYKIQDRNFLSGFNLLALRYGDIKEYKLPNRFTDRRDEIKAGITYNCMVMNYSDSYHMQLVADRITNAAADPNNLRPTDYVTEAIGTLISSTTKVTAKTEGIYVNARVMFYYFGEWYEHTGDWMLYDGYVHSQGQIEVELTTRSTPEEVSKSSPKYFRNMVFGGAWKGAGLTVLSASVRPVFVPHPTESTKVTFADVGAHDIKCIDVMNALRHMFNLYFYTDSISKTVYIEPRDIFYERDVVLDWSDKIDYSKPLSVGELGSDVNRKMIFRYKSGDEASSKWNMANSEVLGMWSADVRNSFAANGERTYENALFRTSINTSGILPSVPSASFVQVGAAIPSKDNYIEDFNFPAKIVRYAGVRRLTGSERWSWPTYGMDCPFLAFHYSNPRSLLPPLSEETVADAVDQSFTLCFEDRDGITGLHRYWDSNLRAYNEGVRLTVYMRLDGADIEQIVNPNQLKRDFRALFRLKVNGEWSDWRLEEVCDYNPRASSTKCIFIKNV